MNLFLRILLLIINSLIYNDSRFDFLAAIRAEGKPVTFQVGVDTFRGAAAFAGVPGGLDGVVNELSDILWCVIAVDSKATILFRTPRGCL